MNATEPAKYRAPTDILAPMPSTHTRAVEIVYDTTGDPADPPVVLIAGMGNQLIYWGPEIVADLAGRGYFVIRLDNRDAGLSTSFDDWGKIDLKMALASSISGRDPDVPYHLGDMAEDVVGLIDHLGIERVHVVGQSMGGMIAQRIAIDHPQRVLSLTSMMSTTGNPAVGAATSEASSLLTRAPAEDRVTAIESAVDSMRITWGPYFDRARAVARATEAHDRSFRPAGAARQFGAILADGDRTPELASLSVPTLVVHGGADPLIGVSGGEATAAAVPGAKLAVFEHMGHDIPPALWPEIRDVMVRHFEAAT